MTDSRTPFRVVLRGYDPGQVDRRVDELETAVDEARSQILHLQERADQLARERAAAAQQESARPASFEHLGERVGQILTLAEEEADSLRERARREVSEQRAQAEASVEAIRAEVDRYAAQKRSDAETEAARILEDARRAADELRDAAERDAAARLQEAEAVFEKQRAQAASAAADFETTLARRREKAEEEFATRTREAQQRLGELEQHIERSRAESEAAQSEAAREARRVVEEAGRQAEVIVSEAKAVAERVRAHSERELAAAMQRRDSVNAQLANVRQMLTTLTGAAPSVLVHEPHGDAHADPFEEGMDPEDAQAHQFWTSIRDDRATPPVQASGTDEEPDRDTEPDAETEEAGADTEPGGDGDRGSDGEGPSFTPLSPPRVD